MKINLKKIMAGALILASASAAFAAPRFRNKKAISVLSREDGSGTRGAFVELFKIEKKDANGKKVDYTTEEAAITNSTAVMLTSVAGDMYAIGYVSLGSLNSSVKAVKIDGAAASVENINNGSYKVSRPFNIAVKDDLSDVAQDFVNFIFSDEGQKIVEKNKYIPVATTKNYKSTKASGKVVVSGSSSVSPVMEKIIEAYKTVNPNAKVELQTSDSTTGVTNAINGNCDIGMASRGLKESELAKGVKGMVMAIDGIAVVVNNANPINELSKAQVEEIFTGKVTKWNKIK
ncbi:MAG: substrate-binding domain-containing protein [Treponema sp.]|nr:substrate-binding domain-containing protein [Treponema sp.]